MKIELQKRKKGLFEKIFTYPSFSLRFGVSIGILLFFSLLAVILIIPRITTWANRFSALNLLLQGITLIFGIVAAFFALKQLTESRYSKLEEMGGKDLRAGRYFSALSNWREALFIKPTSAVLLNLMEAYLISEELKDFDEMLGYLEKKKSFQQKTIKEPKDYLIYCYLKVFRSLFIENMGAAKDCLKEMLDFTAEKEFKQNIGWSFDDVKKCVLYKQLTGDHKKVADNLIYYLERRLTTEDEKLFKSGNYLFPANVKLIQSNQEKMYKVSSNNLIAIN